MQKKIFDDIEKNMLETLERVTIILTRKGALSNRYCPNCGKEIVDLSICETIEKNDARYKVHKQCFGVKKPKVGKYLWLPYLVLFLFAFVISDFCFLSGIILSLKKGWIWTSSIGSLIGTLLIYKVFELCGGKKNMFSIIIIILTCLFASIIGTLLKVGLISYLYQNNGIFYHSIYSAFGIGIEYVFTCSNCSHAAEMMMKQFWISSILTFIFVLCSSVFPIFKDEEYSFKFLSVIPFVENYLSKAEIINHLYVLEEDNIIRGFVQIEGEELIKLYVDPFFQGRKYGSKLISYCIKEFNTSYLWALEKNIKARKFYNQHGFIETKEKKLEEDTTEYLLKLERK